MKARITILIFHLTLVLETTTELRNNKQDKKYKIRNQNWVFFKSS